ncbi:hypothetical protein D0S48_14555 [Psychrobacillus sp. AK 1817]|uniref:stalk domain-containing protein n=1 Tax=Psychrobacillus sp. AK 1817 TaxID=2303505 RepID=UPI001247FF1F|nr:stalk domain-containing protein [Psychrobacillus sp. AK 1817]QEY21795.1 hypothetical protein D0S48_14555 [Psychrobacillus sp. AK 1817]
MKKLHYLSFSFIAICLLLTPTFVLAKEGEDTMVKENSKLERFTGIVKEVVNKEDNVILTVETEQKEPIVTVFTITNETLLYNSGTAKEIEKKEFVKGQRIEAYYDKTKARTMIYPAQISPELIIAHDGKNVGFTKVGVFDEKLTSEDNQLKLNLSKETLVVNKDGESIDQKNLVGNELIVFYKTSTRSIPAQTIPNKVVVLEEKDASNFMKFSGTIKEVSKNNKEVTLTVETNEKEPQISILVLNKDVIALNSASTKAISIESFKKGMKIDAYYDKNKPMILIYPPRISPEIIVAHEEKSGLVKVSKFDEQFVSLDKELKLQITNKTELVDEKGKKISKNDLTNKELIVFYSSPKNNQKLTTPSKIIALEYIEPVQKELNKIIENDHLIQNGVKMIPIREVAQYLGYEVMSHPKRNSVYLKLGNSSFSITRGELKYGYNRSIREFQETPVLHNKKTYVSEDILEILVPES